MLDMRRVRVLCEVGRQRSFSGAAAALGYTQPAVSRQIAVLESEIGTTLVRRVPQGALLTDAGRLLAERAEAIFGSVETLQAEVRALAGLAGGRLRMASFSSAAAVILPTAVARFRASYPEVELELELANPGESLPRLRGGEVDLAISNGLLVDRDRQPDVCSTNGGAIEGLQFEHLFDDPMYVAMPASHRLATKGKLRLHDLADAAWMLAASHTCPDSQLFLRACHDAGFEPRIAFQNDDYPAILGFVATGVGVAVIPDMVARSVREDVIVRSPEPPLPTRPILAATPAGYCSPAASAMVDVLREICREWVAQQPKAGPNHPIRP